MPLTKVTLEVDQAGLNDVIAAIAVHRDRLVALGQSLTAQAQAQIDADAKIQARKAKKAKPA